MRTMTRLFVGFGILLRPFPAAAPLFFKSVQKSFFPLVPLPRGYKKKIRKIAEKMEDLKVACLYIYIYIRFIVIFLFQTPSAAITFLKTSYSERT